jgi:ligand-binding sensor domain-containing protein/serine phosphatase RsbU (regulator of sigma subunit)
LKTKSHDHFRPCLKVNKAIPTLQMVMALITILFYSSCSTDNREHSNEKKTDTFILPVSVLMVKPIVVNLDTCPPPTTIKLSTPTTIQTVKFSNGISQKLLPPEEKSADFLSFIKNYSSDQGLPIDMMACALIDKKGNLWFGTAGGGISRYEGKSFTNFTTLQGLVNDAVWCIMEDKNENIWIGTYGGGVSRYNGKSFINFNTSQGLADNYVLSILEDRHGDIWFGTLDGGVSRYDGKTFANYSTKQGLANNRVWAIVEDKKGNLLFGTNGGMSCYDGKSFTTINKQQGLLSNTVKAIAEDEKGNFWLATESGVSYFTNDSCINYTTEQGLPSNDIRNIQEDKKGNLWFGTFNGVSCYNGKTFTNYSTKNGLINDKVVNMTIDKAGNLWILTFGGVSCYQGESFINYTPVQGIADAYGSMEDKKGNVWFNMGTSGIVHFDGKKFTSYALSQGFPNSSTTCMLEDRVGNIWFGTYARGIHCFDGKSLTTYGVKQGLIDNSISCCIMDKKGDLWFGSHGGIFCYNGKSFINYTTAQGLPSNFILSILEDRSGKLWIGTDDGGLSCFDGKFFKNYSYRQGLPNNNVRNIIEDKAGNLWIATDAGACRFDGRSFLNYSILQGLPDKAVMQIAVTQEQNLAMGTNKGLAVMTAFKKNSPGQTLHETIPAQNDLRNEELKMYVPVFEVFNSATGYPVKDVNSAPGSIFKDSKGMLWIATGSNKTAMVRFDYAKLNRDNTLPVVFIQNIKINNEIICWSDLSKTVAIKKDSTNELVNTNVQANITEEVTSLGRELTDAERDTMYHNFADIQFDNVSRFYPIPQNLVLPYKNNSITFDFAAIEPAKPYLVKYQYQLEGYDDDWSSITNKTTATFGNIYEGSYTFKLKAQGPSGLWSIPITYSFKVLPPWWRTWWMYGVYAILIIGFVIIIVWWNGRRLRERAKELAEEIKKATVEIIEQKKIVEEKNKIVEERNKNITDSINYALRIQKAFLPKREEFYSSLPKSFILFKPKDIVSGDFYFFHKTFPLKENAEGGLLFIAAVDCTGHGVPGAFLSMVGSERLTDAVQQSNNASEILSLLNKGVKNSLHQTGEDESTRDGMDIAICSLDVKQRIVKYAGANRPLWLIRKDKNEVEEIKSTKVAVGGLTEDDQRFESHELQLQEGDTFYIFSDGYADIFSGESGKKLTTKKFKQLLLNIQNKTMQEQEQYLDRFIEDWKAGTEQVDDILVIGIRI